MSFRKVGALCQFFFAKEQRKALNRKPDEKLQVDFFAEHQIGAARDVPTKSFYDRIIV